MKKILSLHIDLWELYFSRISTRMNRDTLNKKLVSDIDKLIKYSKIKDECIIWTGYTRRAERQPAFKSKLVAVFKGGDQSISSGREVYVRKFVLGLALDDMSPMIRAKCINKKCVNPNHLFIYNKQLNEVDNDTMKQLIKDYPLAYLSRWFGISKAQLKRFRDD